MIDRYHYTLPENQVAHTPAEPRDSSRLLVYDTKQDKVYFDIFKNISKYIPQGAVLVLNDTKVLPARVILSKEIQGNRGGGKIEVLFLVNEYARGSREIQGIVDRKIVKGQKLIFSSGEVIEVVDQHENIFTFALQFDPEVLFPLLFASGITPLPQYIHQNHLDEEKLRERYQAIFAKNPASIAAPTASLHFTPQVFESLKAKEVTTHHVTLHVGLGTFAPITEENFKEGKLHKEYFDVESDTAAILALAQKQKIPIIPVGTTALRVLETIARRSDFGSSVSDSTRIFIYPPFEFLLSNGLITNFHVPKSSLMCLVDAFLTHKKAKKGILELYSLAIQEGFRFYSFGDAMFIL